MSLVVLKRPHSAAPNRFVFSLVEESEIVITDELDVILENAKEKFNQLVSKGKPSIITGFLIGDDYTVLERFDGGLSIYTNNPDLI